MFDYGIKASLLAGLNIYSHASRGSGRTTNMMALIKEGDYVIVPNKAILDEVRRELKKRGVEVGFSIVQGGGLLDELHRIRGARRAVRLRDAKAKIHIDHFVIEQFYQTQIERMSAELDHFMKDQENIHEGRLRATPIGLYPVVDFVKCTRA